MKYNPYYNKSTMNLKLNTGKFIFMIALEI